MPKKKTRTFLGFGDMLIACHNVTWCQSGSLKENPRAAGHPAAFIRRDRAQSRTCHSVLTPLLSISQSLLATRAAPPNRRPERPAPPLGAAGSRVAAVGSRWARRREWEVGRRPPRTWRRRPCPAAATEAGRRVPRRRCRRKRRGRRRRQLNASQPQQPM